MDCQINCDIFAFNTRCDYVVSSAPVALHPFWNILRFD